MAYLNCPCSRLYAVWAVVAGTILAGGAVVTVSGALAQDDIAMAVPRLAPSVIGNDAVSLPHPLPAAAARLVRAAFSDPSAPLDVLAGNPVLGHILADRFLSIAAHPSIDDLRDWLSRYGTLPDAPAIYALLCARLPRGSAPPPPVLASFTAAPAGDDIESADRLLPRDRALDRSVRDAAHAGQFDRAIRLVQRARTLPPGYAALLRAEIARAMFSQGKDLDALTLADAANQQARGNIGLAPWVGGLAAWRLGRFELAGTLFDAAYRAPVAAPGQRSGAAYWAARANLVTHGDHGPWLYRAARDARTFYGLLARKALGQPIHADEPFDQGTLAGADIDAVGASGRGMRAFALLQVNQAARAGAELRQLFTETQDQPGFGRSILLVARAAGLQDLANQLDGAMQPAMARLPRNRLRPSGGFVVDPALVYALTRIESNFDPDAISPVGARGLMQVMPGTADYVLAGSGRRSRLHDPAANLDIGQRYLIHLSHLDLVGTDLVRLLASYNAGPGNFGHWLENMRQETDPLLFMESLPGEETRAYVPRALAYQWLYAAQLGLPSPSLDELAAGLWPHLQVQSERREPVVRLH